PPGSLARSWCWPTSLVKLLTGVSTSSPARPSVEWHEENVQFGAQDPSAPSEQLAEEGARWLRGGRRRWRGSLRNRRRQRRSSLRDRWRRWRRRGLHDGRRRRAGRGTPFQLSPCLRQNVLGLRLRRL